MWEKTLVTVHRPSLSTPLPSSPLPHHHSCPISILPTYSRGSGSAAPELGSVHGQMTVTTSPARPPLNPLRICRRSWIQFLAKAWDLSFSPVACWENVSAAKRSERAVERSHSFHLFETLKAGLWGDPTCYTVVMFWQRQRGKKWLGLELRSSLLQQHVVLLPADIQMQITHWTLHSVLPDYKLQAYFQKRARVLGHLLCLFVTAVVKGVHPGGTSSNSNKKRI